MMCLILRIHRLADTKYRRQVRTGCLPYSVANFCINRSATSIVLSKEIRIPSTISYLSAQLIATQSQT